MGVGSWERYPFCSLRSGWEVLHEKELCSPLQERNWENGRNRLWPFVFSDGDGSVLAHAISSDAPGGARGELTWSFLPSRSEPEWEEFPSLLMVHRH